MPINKLREFLDKNNVKYVVISHSLAYTAQEIAARAHIPGKELAKTVIVNLDGKLHMAVLPASNQIELPALKAATGATSARLASEIEFKDNFPDCAVGAMPPFGNLYGITVFVDESLTADKEIAFNACSHNELIRLAYEDFVRLTQPRVLKFAVNKSSGRAA
jgi:Ala-tRNA(Pro) deacylase